MDYIKDIASRQPLGRLLAALYRLGSDSRIANVEKEVDLSEKDFLSAIAEAEWGGLLKREERDGAFHLTLTPPGQKRAEAIVGSSAPD